MTFDGLNNEELADIWYAVSGAEIRHTGCFSQLVAQSYAELLRRLGNQVGPFVEERFRQLRAIDAREDVAANVKATAEPVACSELD